MKNGKEKFRLNIFLNSVMGKGISGTDNRAINYTKQFILQNISIRIFAPTFYVDYLKGVFSEKENKLIEYVELPFKIEEYSFFRALKKEMIRPFSTKISNNLIFDRHDILYCPGEFLSNLIPALKIKQKYNVPLIVGKHLLWQFPLHKYKYIKEKKIVFPSIRVTLHYIYQEILFSTLFRNKIDLFTVSNSFDKEYVINKGINPNKILVLPGAIDTKRYESVKRQERIYDAVFIGRPDPLKLNKILTIWKNVVEKIPQAQLLIIGDQIDKLLERELEELGLENNVIFRGYIEGDEKIKLLKSSKILVYPSTHDSFAMVVLEALTTKTVPILYPLEPFYEYFRNGAVIVNNVNHGTYSEQILDLLKNNKKRLDISKRGHIISHNFEWKNTSQLLLKRIYSLLLDRQ